MFVGFEEGKMYVKIKKLGKKKSLTSSWEGPFLFMKMSSWNKMKEVEFMSSKGRMKSFGIDLEEIYKSTMLHLER